MSEQTTANAEQAEYWAQRAPAWMAFEQTFEHVSGPLGRQAMDLLDLAPGMVVLDVGCGTGGTTLQLAERVAPGGSVLGVDISPPLLERARAKAAAANAEATFTEADAQTHDLGEHRFDAAYSRFGVMFFADPVEAFTNIRRSLRPGATLSFVAWREVFANEWILVPAIATITTLGVTPEPSVPDEPGPFALADPERVRKLLTEAGFGAVEVRPHADAVTFPEERIPAFAEASTRMGLVAELLDEAGEERRRDVVEAIEAVLRERAGGGVVSFSRAALLVTARA